MTIKSRIIAKREEGDTVIYKAQGVIEVRSELVQLCFTRAKTPREARAQSLQVHDSVRQMAMERMKSICR